MKLHFSFFFRQLIRVMKPGRVIVVHCQDIVRMKRTGGAGIYDFRSLLTRLGERVGFVHDYTWAIRKNPQSQAIRTKSRSLQFAGLESDRVQSRGAMPDYVIKFLAPGENAVPVRDIQKTGNDDGDVSIVLNHDVQVTRNQWIDYAEYCWDDIRETDTLNVKEARSPEDVRHICALQLSLVDRLVRLFTNHGEIVFSPFCGVGTELYTALKLGRRAYGTELKTEYYQASIRNCERALNVIKAESCSLYAGLDD